MDVYILFKIKILVNAFVDYRQEDFIKASRCQSVSGFRASHLTFVPGGYICPTKLGLKGSVSQALQGRVYCSATTMHQKGMSTG